MKISEMEASKFVEASCRIRLSRSSSIRALWAPTKLLRPPWETTTPFGRPVEPEV